MRLAIPLVLLSLATTATAAPLVNQLVNGSFEVWDAGAPYPEGWDGFRMFRSSDASEGVNAVLLHARSSGPGHGSAGMVSTAFTAPNPNNPQVQAPLVPGAAYELSYVSNGTSVGAGYTHIRILYNYAGASFREQILPFAFSATPEERSVRFTAPLVPNPPTAVHLNLYSWSQGGGEYKITVDDVRLGLAAP